MSSAPRSLAVLAAAALLSGSGASAVASAGELGPRLRYLRHLVQSGRIAPPARIAVSLLVGPEFDARARMPAGVELRHDAAGGILRTDSVLPLRTELGALEGLAALPGVELVETSWFPRSPPPPLDISRAEVESPLVWPETDAAGIPLTGSGVVIADLDSGVDQFHPHFFRPDGGRFRWLDVDSSGDPTSGVDAIDLDGNGLPGAGETLRIFETPLSSSYPTANPAGCDSDIDWLYADSNGDGGRNFGRAAGFSDLSPGFGEPMFAVEDANGNGRLDDGETLLMLGSSKIRAVRQRDGSVRRRGVDLIDSEGDGFISHGTWVSGILLGGIAGHSRLAGQAPDAELIVAGMYYPSVPPFEDDMATLALWAKSEGARVMLYESGNWVWAWLDGSHPNEVTMSDLGAEGFLQLTPTGNLSGGGQQQTRSYVSGVPGTLSATTRSSGSSQATVVWPSLLWRGLPADADVTVEVPGGATLSPCYCATTEAVGGFDLYSDRSLSPRGTVMLNFEIRKSGGGTVAGTWAFHVRTTRDLEVLAYSWDDISGWSGNTTWDQADNLHTVTQPATGDRSIAIAAYSPRDCGGCTPAGQINGFSGRGTRIDGISVVDVATPGSRVYATAPWQGSLGAGAITAFGGTSSALPHAAGAAALLVQLNPNDPHDVIERLLRDSALVDGFTGAVPNDTWGMGKLRIRRAYELAAKPSLLRDDSLTSLAMPRAPLFPGSGPVSLDLVGANGYSQEGEGVLLGTAGSSDGDAFLAAHVDPGFRDPEGPDVVRDSSRPLIFYQATGEVVLRLVKDSAGIRIDY